jgi:hypothetical protein
MIYEATLPILSLAAFNLRCVKIDVCRQGNARDPSRRNWDVAQGSTMLPEIGVAASTHFLLVIAQFPWEQQMHLQTLRKSSDRE